MGKRRAGTVGTGPTRKSPKISKNKVEISPDLLAAKKNERTGLQKDDDYVYDVPDLPVDEDGWKPVILSDAVLQSGDLQGLGCFEEIDGSYYDIIKSKDSFFQLFSVLFGFVSEFFWNFFGFHFVPGISEIIFVESNKTEIDE